MQPDQARPHEFEPAFHLLFRHQAKQERDSRVARVVELLHSGEIDPRGLFVLRGKGGLLGVIACEPVAGAAGILWPPIVVDRRDDLEDLLVQHACEWLRDNGARLGQCLLPPADLHLGSPLLRNGFSRIAGLSYLCHDRLSSIPRGSRTPPLRFEPYDRASPEVFHETLAWTYSETLDCPEVNGVRTVEEVVAGYQVQDFATGRWWLAWADERPVGVLIATAESGGESWDVGYMGIVPTARHRGLGRAMLHKVLLDARSAGAQRVTLCVDERNTPACRLYRGMGFLSYDHRAIFLAIWKRAE